jgi:hypothetical protein
MDEPSAGRRRENAARDFDDRTESLLYEVVGGTPKAESRTIATDAHAALWDALAAEIAELRADPRVIAIDTGSRASDWRDYE